MIYSKLAGPDKHYLSLVPLVCPQTPPTESSRSAAQSEQNVSVKYIEQ